MSRLSLTSSKSTCSFNEDEKPEATRFVVVMDPADMKAYSISFRYVQQTSGLNHVLSVLEKNATRKHKKHIQAALCDSIALGTVCPFGQRCPNIHATREGYAKRRIWDRPLTIQRLATVRERRSAEWAQLEDGDHSFQSCQLPNDLHQDALPSFAFPPVDGNSVSFTTTRMSLFSNSADYSGMSYPSTLNACHVMDTVQQLVQQTTPSTLFSTEHVNPQCFVSAPSVPQTWNTLTCIPTTAELPIVCGGDAQFYYSSTSSSYATTTIQPAFPRKGTRIYRPPMNPPTTRSLPKSTAICTPIEAPTTSSPPTRSLTPTGSSHDSAHSSSQSQQNVTPESSPAPAPFTHSPYAPMAALSLPAQPIKKAIQPLCTTIDAEDDADFIWADINPNEKMNFTPLH